MAKQNAIMLTEHFSLSEMTRSAWAERNGVTNCPDILQTTALANLCQTVLEPLRQQFGPITIRGAFKNERVNTGEHCPGASKHLSGEAVDISFRDEETGRSYFRFIKCHCNIDQMFFEYNRKGAMWLHVSACLDPRENRNQVFPNYLATYEQ